MPQVTALLLTLAVEVPLYVAALVVLRLAGFGRALLLAVGVNLLTHPLLWWALGPRPSLLAVVVAEVAVWLVEAALVWLVVRRSLSVVLVVAAGVNAASILVGVVVGVVVGLVVGLVIAGVA
jgi:hypothetical protein